MEEKEYEHKWQYVMHTERMQAGFIQWYLTVCAATFVFLYSNESAALTPLINDRWLALVVLSLYSVLTCLRLLAQKKNYHAYTVRIRELEGNKGDNKSESVFRVQATILCDLLGRRSRCSNTCQ